MKDMYVERGSVSDKMTPRQSGKINPRPAHFQVTPVEDVISADMLSDEPEKRIVCPFPHHSCYHDDVRLQGIVSRLSRDPNGSGAMQRRLGEPRPALHAWEVCALHV